MLVDKCMYNELSMCISIYVMDGYCVLLGSMTDSWLKVLKHEDPKKMTRFEMIFRA